MCCSIKYCEKYNDQPGWNSGRSPEARIREENGERRQKY